jgi:hypothetical protein
MAMEVVWPPPKAKPKKKFFFFFFVLRVGRTTPWGHGVAEATPRLNWGGQPPQLFPSFILNSFYYFNFNFLFQS